MTKQENKVLNFESIKFWKPPFSRDGMNVFDSEGQFCFIFDSDDWVFPFCPTPWDIKKRDELRQEIIDILNDKTDKKITSKLEVVDRFRIFKEGKPFICMRGLGDLIEPDGKFWLDLAVWKKVQDDLAKWIFDKLTK